MDKKNRNEEMIDAVKKEIHDSNYIDDSVSFDEIPVEDNSIYKVFDNQDFDYSILSYLNREMFDSYDKASSQKLEGNIIVKTVKAIIRKMNRFLTEPIIKTQKDFNKLTVESISQTRSYISKTIKEKEELEKTIEELKKEVEHLKNRISESEEK